MLITMAGIARLYSVFNLLLPLLHSMPLARSTSICCCWSFFCILQVYCILGPCWLLPADIGRFRHVLYVLRNKCPTKGTCTQARDFETVATCVYVYVFGMCSFHVRIRLERKAYTDCSSKYVACTGDGGLTLSAGV